ncbi:MAG TPA: T9SS type A sorting domain-containing protein [Ignavibacteria bacterium]|nr:hypothetical protein [Bacteroidota bacterium]HRE11397.1 T9SS type A sorting domain-containing protein [Ignavibacteria bacterium]HRF65401.1 T9SS type A sorting domain-containing protein [Ignavibacteria bacterium]HRJ04677.1 T9SS type A sorting domain-containing protein [Ignavibacteria bacterium]
MKNLYFSLLLLFFFLATSYSQLLPGYNTAFSEDVLSSAESIAMPFLLQQGVKVMPGVQIYNDTMLLYQGKVYRLTNIYQNPEPGNSNGYYIEYSSYGEYGINIFSNVWHINFPRVIYSHADSTFYSMADCVGFGTRVLSAIGDTTQNGNAYLSLIKTIKDANTTMMAVRGYVASAYELGAAFPTLPDNDPSGWSYVSGNVIADSIDAYNHRVHPALGKYNGRIKGGFNNCEAGDILEFSYAPGGESNGHFMVMSSQPYTVNFDTLKHFYPNVSDTSITLFLNTYDVYAVPVYDCSGKEAHFHDSRLYSSGIGHGILWILTEKTEGIPVGLIFKTPGQNVVEINAQMISPLHTWAISVGRYRGKISGTGYNGHELTPKGYRLEQNYPNPFNPQTSINFTIPSGSIVKLSVFDVLGREVASPVNEYRAAGSYDVSFDAASLSSGVYYYRIAAGEYSETKKMIVLK